MKHLVSFLLAVALLFLVGGCGAYIPAVFEDPGITPNPSFKFDYTSTTPRKLQEPLTFLLISPSYEVKFPNTWAQGTDKLKDIVEDFSSAMERDFNKLLVDRRFRLISLLKDQQLATYSQREQSTFSLRSKIEVEIDAVTHASSEPKMKLGTGLVDAKTYEPGLESGQFNIKTKIVLEVKEPITWQLIWVKTLEDEGGKSINYSFKWNYSDAKTMTVRLGSDSRPQSLADVLMDVYRKTLSQCESYIDPEEFAILSKQSSEIRKKATGVVK